MNRVVINTDKAPAAIGPYSQAIQAGNLLFISGQIPIDPTTGAVVEGDIQAQTKQCMENLKGICEAAGTCLSNVIKTTIFITDMNQFAKVNEVYAEYCSVDSPARACVEVSALPKAVLVEIEAVVLVS